MKQSNDYILFYFNNQLIDYKNGISFNFYDKFDFDIIMKDKKNIPFKIYLTRNMGVLEKFSYNSLNDFYSNKREFTETAKLRLEKGDFIVVELLNTNFKQSNVFFIYVRSATDIPIPEDK
jgi:hypothetical protein